jgi:hypothetical protein
VWPSDLTIRICSESGRKWVTFAENREPFWWKESRKRYVNERNITPEPDVHFQFAAEHLANEKLPNIETVEEAK